MEKKTILIAVKEKLLRETWAILLNSFGQFIVVAATSRKGQVLQLVKEHHSTIILTDIEEIELVLLALLRNKENPVSFRAICILSTTTSTLSFIRRLINTGGMGLITKNVSLQEMIYAISEVAEKGKYICSEINKLNSVKTAISI